MARILFLHPDLGIGGAERLVIDAALALKQKGHNVSFLTNHYNPDHCFEETRNDNLRIDVIGDWLPRKIFGRFYALCAYFRMLYAAFYTTFILSRQQRIDIIFCDLISFGIPILKLAKYQPKIIFYCHYPDQLLSTKGNIFKRIYRAPIDYFEEITTAKADRVLVNSKYTRRIFRETFKRLSIVPDVLYPSINMKFFDLAQNINDTDREQNDSNIINLKFSRDNFIFLSINRYERKKNLQLAIESFNQLKFLLLNRTHSDKDNDYNKWDRCRLILAGGYDLRVIENVEYYNELKQLADELEIIDKVTLLRSPTDREKLYLLKISNCLLYTPENEHFGIVPLEGMYMLKPVIASNSGGPTETIINESTGFLCEQNKYEFSKAMLKLLDDNSLGERMGEMGRKRVQQKFSFEAFTDKLDCIVNELLLVNDDNSKNN